MTILEWGALCLVAGGLFYWLGILPKVQVILGFVGTCIVTGGLFGTIMTRLVTWLDSLTNAVTGKALGVAVPGLLVIILGIIFIHDLLPKKSPGKRTVFVGILLAACLVGGLSSFQTLNGIPANIRNGVGSASTITGR